MVELFLVHDSCNGVGQPLLERSHEIKEASLVEEKESAEESSLPNSTRLGAEVHVLSSLYHSILV